MSRAPRQEATGTAGESETMAEFERLGWGAVINARHDTGTDLILWARDDRRFDIGVFIGAQVKSGNSQFDDPVLDENGDLLGWWFRDDDRSHIDDWVEHGSPFLILLHDLEKRVTYWEHVTPERIVETGVGAKILVPSENTVDEPHREALLGIAATARPRIAWEGTAWTGAMSLAPRDHLRHALLVPRLIAPHPNAGTATPLSADKAIALLVQGRLRDLERFASVHMTVPTLDEAFVSEDWSWRFVGALGRYLTAGLIEPLLGTFDQAPDAASRSASCITAVSAWMAEGRADEALSVLEIGLADDSAGPVDHAWLTVQFARICSEIGRIDDARRAAFDVQSIRVTNPDDVTATGLAGFAAELLFQTANWDQRDLAAVITQRDTAAAWWRTQTTSYGLEAFEDRTYKSWARDSTVTFGGTDDAHNQLLAASLTANNMGDHASWRHVYGLLGEDTLVRLDRSSEPELAKVGLDTLRLAGDESSLKLAINRLTTDGPIDGVRLAASGVDLATSTRTTGPTNLALVEHGGHLLDEAIADRYVTWLLATIKDPDEFIRRTTPSYLVQYRLIDTLAGVLPAASVITTRQVLTHLIGLAPQKDQLVAMSWAKVIAGIRPDAWNHEVALELAEHADAHITDLKLAVLGIAARFDTTARSRLIEEAGKGSLSALGTLGDVRRVDPDVVKKQVSDLTEIVLKRISDAAAGAYGFGGHDEGRALALLSMWHPELANWEPLLMLLKDPRVAPSNKQGVLIVLASNVAQLPAEVRPDLEDLVKSTPEAAAFPIDLLMGASGDLLGPFTDLAVALGVLDEGAVANRMLDLLSGDPDRRQWAARVAHRLNRPDYTSVLVTLIHDTDPSVRAVAATGLCSLVAAGTGGPIVLEALRRTLSDPGLRVPLSVASALRGISKRSEAANDVLNTLQQHASAVVRMAACGIDSHFAAYEEFPLDKTDAWGDLDSFHNAIADS
jgi:hypothetical protein